MKKIFGIFKQTWFLTLIGVIAISLLIFFLGDVLQVGGYRPFGSLQSRSIAIGCISFSWVAYHLWQWLRNRKLNQQMLSSLVENAGPSADEQASEEERQQLQENLQDALNTLKSIHGKDGNKNYLYQSPWYVVIGPPGAGKTTLLANSKLHFPLSDKYGKDALRGVGGTRNCDWWFTDEAILLDTAGRYTTQDSQENVDRAAWQGFLGLLKKNRPHQPINGILIAISIADILQLTAEEQEKHANTIRKRIQELHEHLGIRFPVYMIFTKCDLLSGFGQFFDDLDAEGRDQVWGMTFAYDDKPEQSAISQFGAEFALLEERLYQQLLEKMDKERALDRRQSLYLFPQQFSALKETLATFLTTIYQPSRYHQTPLLRGVYFTSATQEGTPIDRIMASLASSYGVATTQTSRFSEKGKSFFINRLLQNVVFTESGLAGTNVKMRQKLRWLQIGVAAAVLLFTLGMAALLGVSYFNNRTYINEYEAKVDQIDKKIAQLPDTADMGTRLMLLGEIRQSSKSYADQALSIPIMSRFGLSQAKGLGEKMDSKYENLLHKIIRPYVKTQLEASLRHNVADNPEATFNALKTYLFIGKQAPVGTSIIVEGIDWNNNGEMGDAQDRELSQHLNNLLKNYDQQEELDTALVNEVRVALERIDVTRLVYSHFVASSTESASRFNFDVLKKTDLDTIGRSFVRSSGRAWSDGIPGLFTKEGYEQVFLPSYLQAAKRLADDAWVLGEGRSLGNLSNAEAKLFEHYQDDYIKLWDGFLGDIKAQTVTNREQAKQVFMALTANGGNLLFRLIQEVKSQTDFKSDVNKDEGNSTSPVQLKIPEKIQNHFNSFSKWDEDAEFQNMSQLIGEISQGLSQDNTFEKLEDNPLKNALDKLDGESEKFPAPIRNIIKSLVEPSEKLVLDKLNDKAKADFKTALKNEVTDLCNQQLAGLFPLKKNSSKAVSLADFSRFFQSGGAIDLFEQQYLQDPKTDQDLKSRVQRAFAPIAKIREGFFSSGILKADFGLELVRADPNIIAIELSIGSLTNRFEPGTVIKRMFSWPSSEVISAVVSLKDPEGKKFEIPLYQGDAWGIFRFVEHDIVKFPNWNSAEFRVYAPKPNAFRVTETILRGFKCPVL